MVTTLLRGGILQKNEFKRNKVKFLKYNDYTRFNLYSSKIVPTHFRMFPYSGNSFYVIFQFILVEFKICPFDSFILYPIKNNNLSNAFRPFRTYVYEGSGYEKGHFGFTQRIELL